MSDYAELTARAQALMAEAKALFTQERAAAIEDIRRQMATWGLRGADLGAPSSRRSLSGSPPPFRVTALPPQTRAKAKYRNAEGRRWSGTGKQPDWVTQALAEGKRLEDFLIDRKD